MTLFNPRTLAALILLSLALALAMVSLVACEGNNLPIQAPGPTATLVPPPTSTPPSTSSPIAPTPAPHPTADATQSTPIPMPTVPPFAEPIATLSIPVEMDTTWQEIYDVLTLAEQKCIQGEFPDGLAVVLDYPVFNDDGRQSDVALYECLHLPTARALLLDGMVTMLVGVFVSDEREEECVRDVVIETDPVSIVKSIVEYTEDEIDVRLINFMGNLWHCFPDLIIDIVVYNLEVEESEYECLERVIREADSKPINLLLSMGMEFSEPAEGDELDEITSAMRACDPDIQFYYEREAHLAEVGDDHGNNMDGATPFSIGELVHGELEYEDDLDYFIFRVEAGKTYLAKTVLGTLGQSFFNIETAREWIGEASNYGESGKDAFTYFVAPKTENYFISVYGYSTGTYTLRVTPAEQEDDHTDFTDYNATPIVAGVSQSGKLNYLGDTDVFWLKAEEGNIYQFETGEGSLDTTLTLYDVHGERLVENDDYYTHRFSRVAWLAESEGDYFIAVRGHEEGRYVITVTTIEDDHGNYIETATPVKVGTERLADREYENDLDVFAFNAIKGREYIITVDLGTLWDSWLELVDTKNIHAYNEDYEDSLAPRLDWTAPETGEYFVIVGGHDTGSYTLTIAEVE